MLAQNEAVRRRFAIGMIRLRGVKRTKRDKAKYGQGQTQADLKLINPVRTQPSTARVIDSIPPMKPNRGILFALLAAIFFGASAPFAKALLGDSSPQAMAGMLYLGSGLGLAMVRALKLPILRSETRLNGSDLPWLAATIVFGGGLAPLLLMTGLQRTAASTASLLLNLEAVFTALLAWMIFREKFSPRVAMGMIAVVAGGAILSWQGRTDWAGLSGPLLIAGACLSWGIDNNLTQKISDSDPLQITMIKGLAAGSVNAIIAFMLGARLPPLDHVALAAMLGFIGYGVSLVLFVFALRAIGTTRTIAYFSVAPFVGTLVGIAVFHDPVTMSLLLSGTLMAIGVWITTTAKKA